MSHAPLSMLPAIRLGDIEIDIAGRRVRAGDRVLPLTEIEQGLLHLLAGSGGRVLSRDEILDAVWGSDFLPGSNVVDRHIRDLRLKLRDDYRAPRFIATVPGIGYRFLPIFSNHGWGSSPDQEHHGAQQGAGPGAVPSGGAS